MIEFQAAANCSCLNVTGRVQYIVSATRGSCFSGHSSPFISITTSSKSRMNVLKLGVKRWNIDLKLLLLMRNGLIFKSEHINKIYHKAIIHSTREMYTQCRMLSEFSNTILKLKWIISAYLSLNNWKVTQYINVSAIKWSGFQPLKRNRTSWQSGSINANELWCYPKVTVSFLTRSFIVHFSLLFNIVFFPRNNTHIS